MTNMGTWIDSYGIFGQVQCTANTIDESTGRTGPIRGPILAIFGSKGHNLKGGEFKGLRQKKKEEREGIFLLLFCKEQPILIWA